MSRPSLSQSLRVQGGVPVRSPQQGSTKSTPASPTQSYNSSPTDQIDGSPSYTKISSLGHPRSEPLCAADQLIKRQWWRRAGKVGRELSLESETKDAKATMNEETYSMYTKKLYSTTLNSDQWGFRSVRKLNIYSRFGDITCKYTTVITKASQEARLKC